MHILQSLPSNQLRYRTALLALGVGATSLALLGAAPPKITNVTGADPATLAAQQSETAFNISQLGNGVRVETITYNDKTGESPAFLVYTPTSRTISLGASLLGWSFRTRTAQNPDPAWTHAKVRPPAGTGAIWGDPSIASNPALPKVVIIGNLSIPSNKFPGTSIVGGFPGTCNSFGGGCVARSTDGGVSFSIVNCFVDPTDTGQNCPAPFEKTKGHFYDGSAVAITQTGSTFSGFAAFIDTDTSREAVWKMADVTGAVPTQQFVKDPLRTGTLGTMGAPQNGELGQLETHVRLQADGADLWKMSRDGHDLRVNIHGRNSAFKVIAPNAHTPFSVQFPNDAFGQVFVRTGPQFAFDIGTNESGQKEMRFAYVADEGGQSFIQAGFCTMDLSDCERPVEWRLPSSAAPVEFHPAIKFGRTDAATGKGIWRLTYWGRPATGVQVFWSDLVRRDLVPGTKTNSAAGGLVANSTMSSTLTPCSTTGTDGYWGDYDGMAFDSTTKAFSRAYTDSSQGCTTRNDLNALNQHVSEVEIPTEHNPRTLNVAGILFELRDIDNLGDSSTTNQAITVHVPVSEAAPSASGAYEQCVDNDVKMRLVFSATLDPVDHETVHACSTQGSIEAGVFDNACNNDVPQSTPFCIDLAPGASTTVTDGGGLNVDDNISASYSVVLSNLEQTTP